MSTVRRSLVFLALTVIAAILAGLAVLDPFHLRYAPRFVAGTVLLTLVLATITLAVAVKVYPLRVLVLVLGGIAALGWAVVAWLVIDLDDPRTVVSEVRSGDQRLTVLEGGAFALGPVHSVVLRAGDGPFAQESPVWLGAEDGSEPEVAFRGADEVEIRTGTCVLVSRVEAGTLEVDPVHRGTDGC